MKFPVLYKLPVGTLISYTRKSSNCMFVLKGENRMIMKHGNTPRLQFDELIDADGNLYRIKKLKTVAGWTKFFAPIFDFASTECELEVVIKLNVGELLSHMADWKDPSARKIKHHLSKYDRDLDLSPKIYEDFLEG